MELIISILCFLLGGAYCEDQGAGAGQAQPTAVATAGVTPQPTAIPTVEVDPYTPVDPHCNYDHYPTVLYSMAISPGGSKPRACWAAENYPRTYLSYLRGCPSCARNAFIRRYGHRPAEGNYLKHGEWVSRLEYYGTFEQMVARLDRYAAAVDRCVARHPPQSAKAQAQSARSVDRGLCGPRGKGYGPTCPASWTRGMREGCVTLLRRGLLTPRWDD